MHNKSHSEITGRAVEKLSIINRLVKSEDLNHHGTLFAGRAAQWFVEAGFIAAASVTNPANIVCANIHGMIFRRPVRNGSIIRFESRIVLAGKTSLVSYVRVSDRGEFLVDGFLTFVHVNSEGRPVPHGISADTDDPEIMDLQKRARLLT